MTLHDTHTGPSSPGRSEVLGGREGRGGLSFGRLRATAPEPRVGPRSEVTMGRNPPANLTAGRVNRLLARWGRGRPGGKGRHSHTHTHTHTHAHSLTAQRRDGGFCWAELGWDSRVAEGRRARRGEARRVACGRTAGHRTTRTPRMQWLIQDNQSSLPRYCNLGSQELGA